MTKCPKCESELREIGDLKEVCTNEDCKGWFCFCCNKWHPYNTSCSKAGLNWYDVDDQYSYDKWCRNHEEDLLRMLKDSGYYNHCHDVDKYYPKDEEEDDGDYFKRELEELEDGL